MGENTHPSRECIHRVLSVETWKVILLLRQEERVMTYLSVLTGAVGIQYFIRRSVCAQIKLLNCSHLFTALTSIFIQPR